MSNDPKVYLSASEGKYRVIQGGVPISADKRTAAEALAVADHFKLKVSDKMWDGDTGTWRSLRSVGRDPRVTRGVSMRRDPLKVGGLRSTGWRNHRVNHEGFLVLRGEVFGPRSRRTSIEPRNEVEFRYLSPERLRIRRTDGRGREETWKTV